MSDLPTLSNLYQAAQNEALKRQADSYEKMLTVALEQQESARRNERFTKRIAIASVIFAGAAAAASVAAVVISIIALGAR